MKRKPFLFRQNVEYSLQVEAEDLKSAQAKAEETPLEEWDAAKSRLTVGGGQRLFKCLRCGEDTALKLPDLQGWDGSCSNCGMIAQSEVGDPA